MKKILFSLVLLYLAGAVWAQNIRVQGYDFKVLNKVATTSVKNQQKTGTCWSFATTSFVETEMLRLAKPEIDLSEMFFVRCAYIQKVDNYVRMHGNTNLASGGEPHDVMWVLKNFGAVPNSVYSGLALGETTLRHWEMDAVLRAVAEVVVKRKNGQRTTNWKAAITGILDAYLGDLPDTFQYDGKEYNSKSFAKDVIGLKPDDYIELTSYTHHPFYEKFAVEIPDNWLWKGAYNLPLNELVNTIDNALKNGYSVAWAADVSERGFSHRNGLAVVPKETWKRLSRKETKAKFETVIEEKKITQEERQEAFDNYSTQDDHSMHIVGLLESQDGTKFYMIKNSWSDKGDFGGFVYVSESYLRLHTIFVLMHKDAVPQSTATKLR